MNDYETSFSANLFITWLCFQVVTFYDMMLVHFDVIYFVRKAQLFGVSYQNFEVELRHAYLASFIDFRINSLCLYIYIQSCVYM